MHTKTHVYVTEQALKLAKGNWQIARYADRILRGVRTADRYGTGVFGHFYDAKKRKGLWFFKDAIKKGMEFFDSAVMFYKLGNKKKAFVKFGMALHILQDLCTPAHTLNTIHVFGFDDVELYLKWNAKEISLRKPAKIEYDSPEKYFFSAVKKSKKLKAYRCGVLDSFVYIMAKHKKTLEQDELERQSELILNWGLEYSVGFIKFFGKLLEGTH